MPERLSAWAKLTLSLRVVGVRPSDGYHLIDAEMVSLDLCDELEVEAGGVCTLGDDDLVTRALRAVGRTASVRLTKRIPAGAGLGGGSADAAAILRWAGCTSVDVAVALGADVPFCLVGAAATGRARVRGIGEVVEPLPFEERVFTLLTPPIHVSTPAVYRMWDSLGAPTGVEGGNDLVPAALAVAPDLARWRDALGEATGAVPRLAGSGGTWFVEGEFPDVVVDGVAGVVARTRNDRPEGRP